MATSTSWLARLNPWRKADPAPELKATVSGGINMVDPTSLFSSLFSNVEITPWQAWALYKNSSAFAKVIDLIADEVANLEPLVEINGEVDPEHPIQAFLKNPGYNRDRHRFIKELAVQYLVTGTGYLIAYGNVAQRDVPILLDIPKSHHISFFQDFDMWPRDYMYAEGTVTQNFSRDRSNPRDLRWFGVEASGMQTPGMAPLSEIIPIYDMDGDKRGVGLSRLNAIKYDVEMRLKGIRHNSALMDNNARPSGVVSIKETVDEDQMRAMEADLNSKMAGPGNAGRIFVFGGGNMEFTALSQNAKDMDFAKLIEIVEDAIVARYNVPITLFRTTAQTNNNYETAWRYFYYLAALPCFKVIYGGLSQYFSRRLGVSVNIKHDELSNPVLLEQAIKKATALYNAHLTSRNESRTMFGYENVLGGDTIYGSISDVAQAEDYYTDHGLNDPDADNSREAYHDARPENDPIQQAEAESEARARGSARGNPDKGKDKNGKKPAPKKSADIIDISDASDRIAAFAKFLKASKPPGPRARAS